MRCKEQATLPCARSVRPVWTRGVKGGGGDCMGESQITQPTRSVPPESYPALSYPLPNSSPALLKGSQIGTFHLGERYVRVLVRLGEASATVW